MKLPVGRVLLRSLLTIGTVLTVLVLGVSALFFFSYVQTLNARNSTVRGRVPAAFAVYHVPNGDPDAAARAISQHSSIYGLRILTFNNSTLVISAAANPADATSRIRSVPGLYGHIRAPIPTFSQRLVFGLATAFGLRSEHFLLRDVGVDINADPAVLFLIVRQFAFGFLAWLLIVGAIGYAAARYLNREALRPLNEVVAALEALGAGDLAPRSVDAVAKDEYGRLAVAYTSAVREVSAAFAERDRAEAEIQRFIADAAHQLRTPLTVIQGFIGILLKNDPHAAADRERILWSMDRQSRSMGSMIQKLTLLDRWEALQTSPELTDIGECVAEVTLPLAASRQNEGVSFCQDPACYAFVDALEIREAVGNVLDNALKYGAGAPVAVRVGAAERDVVIVVADRGPGMSADEQQNAFRRFYRGEDRQIAGSGLGLTIAKRAVERAGGRISIASAPGDGTSVTVRLPRHTL